MKYIVNGKNFEFSIDDLDSMFIGEGTECSCYRVKDYYNDFVMKLFHEYTYRDTISSSDCEHLIGIPTSRIIMPTSLIYDVDGNYVGYAAPYIEENKTRIKNLKIGRLFEELELLDQDRELLTNRSVDLSDMNLGNTFFSNGIYMSDVGGFKIVENSRFLRQFNRESMNEYQLESIIFKLFKFNKTERKKIRSLIHDDFETISECIGYLMTDKDEDVRTFFKSRI